MKGILVLALAGLFLGCALQVVKSREYFQDANLNDDYNELDRDVQEFTSPDEFDDYNSEDDDDDTDDDDDDDDDDDLDVEVKAADAFDDDDDDENDEELGEYHR